MFLVVKDTLCGDEDYQGSSRFKGSIEEKQGLLVWNWIDGKNILYHHKIQTW